MDPCVSVILFGPGVFGLMIWVVQLVVWLRERPEDDPNGSEFGRWWKWRQIEHILVTFTLCLIVLGAGWLMYHAFPRRL